MTVTNYILANSQDYFWATDFYPIYSILGKLLFAVFPQEQSIIVFNALIISCAVLLFIYEYSDDVFFSVYLYYTLYFYLNSFNTIRQYSAIGFCLIAYVLFEKKSIFSWIAVIFAIGTHITSAVFFVVYLLYKLFPKLHSVGIQLGLCLVGSIVIQYLFAPMFSLVASVLPHYAIYTAGSMSVDAYQGQGRKLILTLVYLFFLFIANYAIKKAEKEGIEIPEKIRQEFYFVSIGVMLGLAGSKLQLIARIESYFTVFAIALIPEVIRAFKGKIRMLVYMGFIVVIFIPFIVQLSGNTSGVLPYMAFWL